MKSETGFQMTSSHSEDSSSRKFEASAGAKRNESVSIV